MKTHARSFAIGFAVGIVVMVCLELFGSSERSWEQFAWQAPVIGTLVGLSAVLRRAMRRAAIAKGRELRRRRGLPVEEERSLREEFRDHPVRTVGVGALLVAVCLGLGWLEFAT